MRLLVAEVIRQLVRADQIDELVGVCASPSDHPRTFAAGERSAERTSRCEQGEIRRAVNSGTHFLPRVDVEHGRQSSTETRRKAARHERNSAYRGINKRAEQSTKVKRIVDRVAVDEDEILIRLAAAHVESRREIIARLDSRQKLNDANDVRFTELRHRFGSACRDLHGADAWPRLEGVAFDGPRLCA